MKADKVAMLMQQEVRGIRVEKLERGYAELEELRVVFDRTSPYSPLVDKVVGLMKKHSFCNTHAYSEGRRGDGKFTMVFARATHFGIEQLERMARKSRAEIHAEAIRRSGTKQGLADDRAVRAILFTLASFGGRMLFSKLARELIRGRGISPNDIVAAMAWLADHKFVEMVINNPHTVEATWRLTRRAGEYFSTFCN